jgi:hypothetical protein
MLCSRVFVADASFAAVDRMAIPENIDQGRGRAAGLLR